MENESEFQIYQDKNFALETISPQSLPDFPSDFKNEEKKYLCFLDLKIFYNKNFKLFFRGKIYLKYISI